ncbi:MULTISPECIES: alpha/beta fold hydrolase [Companilactobacillus]|uniref:Haloperoxidase n=1 Tax=Companilactobacillus heilongjiangensis TaxID=1074467 RepID=A0A0K2L9F4_9LACO|nr:alpha/beta hydrolase [Companilactobacillus heilongjiangensis]ALB27924.1 haloperoxidase [Companilactobacillus heilongjiangensis]
MQFITSDDVRLEYDDVGQGEPILIMTGYAGYKEIWRSQVELLSQHYRVINLDRRNHGRSETTTKGLRMSRQGKDVAELLDYLKINKISMMGNSMGAATIWAYCSLYGDDRINKIISVDQSPKMISDETWPYGLLDLNWNNFPEEAEQMYHVHTTYRNIDDETYKLVKTVQGGKKFDYELNRPLLFDHAFQDWRDVIKTLKVPVLFLSGKESPFWSSEHATASAKLCENGKAIIVPDSGHIIMSEQQELFNTIMMDFLQS